jgi:hypothetical protein
MFFTGETMIKSILKRWFKPKQARDNEGRFLPSRIAARQKAIEMAKAMNRSDLVERLQP